MINSNSDFTSRRLKSLSTGAVTKIGFVPNIQTKKDKPEETPKLKSYSNPYEEFIKTWEPGDVIPIIAPGKSLHLCKYTKSLLNVDSSYYSSTHRHENQKKFKNAEFSDMEYKVLGRKLKDNLQSLLSRAAGARGLWVDDKNKIRCPPGSPAANQFTDITGSNCLIPTARTAAGSGARAIRKATNTAQQLAGETGQRFDARPKPNLATANAQELVDQGLDVVGQAMGFGGRIVTTQEMVDGGLVGSMRVFPKRKLNIVPTAGFAPKNRKRNAPDTDSDVILLGLKEQIWRGRRTTELAEAARERLKNPLTPNGLKLPDGSYVGDIVGSKASFVNALTQLFPNVPVPEIEELYDQAIPRMLNKLERKKLKRALEQFWLSTIADIIQDPEKGKWVTIMKIDNKMDSAVEIKLDHFAPSGSAGGRRISQAAQVLATKKGAYETGGVHVEFKLNPFELYRNIDGSDNGFDRNGRALGVPDSLEGTMHYIATHELGHLSHFAGVMRNLGFDTANLQRYGNVQRLVVPKGQAGPEWQRENNVNAWMVDFRQAKNPMGSRSIQLMIDSANNLNNRQYVRTGNWGNVSGYTRSDLESDLDNFMNSFIYAVNTNITDNQSDRDLMNEFTTGVYATMNTLELRAEYYASRRLFSDPANASVNPFDTFATTLSSAANATQTATGIKQQLIAADDKIYGVKPGNWNLSGKMSAASLSPRPSAKTQRVRRAVDSDGQRNTNRSSRTLSGAMKSPGLQPRTTSGRSWKEQDTISTPSTNMPQSQNRSSVPMMIQSSMESFAPQNTLTGRMSSMAPSLMESNTLKSVERVEKAQRRVDGLEKALNALDETGEWRGGEFGVVLSRGKDKTAIDGFDADVTPRNLSKEEVENEGFSKFKREVEDKIDASKKEVELQEFLARTQKERRQQGILDVEDIPENEYQALVAEGKELRKRREAKDFDAFKLEGNQEAVIHVGKAQLEGGVLNPSRTSTAGMGFGSPGDTGALNKMQVRKFNEEFELSAKKLSTFEATMSSLRNGQTKFTPRDRREAEAITEVLGLGSYGPKIGEELDLLSLPLRDGINPLIERGDIRVSELQARQARNAKLATRINESPEFGFLSAYPASEGVTTRGYYGRNAGEDIPENVAKFSTEAQNVARNRRGDDIDIKDQDAYNRWKVNLRGSAYLIIGDKDDTVVSSLGPSDERQLIGINKPVFGVSSKVIAQPEDYDVAAYALMARATRLKKEGRDITPDSVLGLTGRMSSGTNSSPDKVGNIKIKDGVPQYPRTPTYGPMLGDFNNIFQGVSSWEDFKRIYDDQEVTFLDYETTGIIFDKYGRVLDNGSPTQIGAVKIKNGEVVDRFNIFVNPGKPLQPWSLKNLKDADGNPLTDAYLETQMSLEEAHKMFAEFAGPNALMGVQNAAYDKNVLDDALRAAGIDWSPRGWIDLKDMSGMVLPRYSESNPDGPYKFDKEKQKNVPSNGLADITKYLEVDLGKDHHNADKDAEATAESMRRLINGAIEKNWSSDVFDEKKRKDFVQQTQNQFDSDIKEWEPLFSQHLAEGMTGKMSSSNPILQRAPVFGSGNESNYYNNVSKSSSWKPGALAATEPKRLADRLSAVQEIKKFVNTGNSDSKNNLFSDLNGLDSSFLDYLKSKDETEIMSDLRQAAIEFHSGIDRKVRLNIESSKVMEALQNGIVRKKKKTSLPGLEDRKKEYETDIGIPTDFPEELRPITGYVVHSDTDFSDSEESFKSFMSRTGGDSDRYTFDAYNSDYNNKKGYNNVFGDAEIILNEDVAERTSYGNGDLLDNNVYPVLMDSYNSDIIGRALIDSVGRTDNRASNMIELLYGKYKNNYGAYRKDNGKTKPEVPGVWENRDALILGGIQPSDISEIRIPFKSIDSANSISADDFVKKPRENSLTSPQRIVPLSKDEQKMLVDILSGVPPMDAAPKNIGIRVNDINSYSKLSKDFENYRLLQEANRLKEAASAAGVKFVVTNDFGLDIFAARSFDSRAAKNKDSLQAVEAKMENQIKELIDALRDAAANLRKDSDK